MKILIADDDRTSRTVLASVLEKVGHEVVKTCDGEEAWDAMHRPGSPRLAILDWMMPGLDGAEICRRMRSQDCDEPPYLILLTTREGKQDIAEGLQSGADDYLCKPFDPVELCARVEVGSRMIAIQERLAAKVHELREALAQIKTLRGIVPICASCKKIRDDQGYWSQVESYVSSHSEAQFSHGICPECASQLYPGLADRGYSI